MIFLVLIINDLFINDLKSIISISSLSSIQPLLDSMVPFEVKRSLGKCSVDIGDALAKGFQASSSLQALYDHVVSNKNEATKRQVEESQPSSSVPLQPPSKKMSTGACSVPEPGPQTKPVADLEKMSKADPEKQTQPDAPTEAGSKPATETKTAKGKKKREMEQLEKETVKMKAEQKAKAKGTPKPKSGKEMSVVCGLPGGNCHCFVDSLYLSFLSNGRCEHRIMYIPCRRGKNPQRAYCAPLIKQAWQLVERENCLVGSS